MYLIGIVYLLLLGMKFFLFQFWDVIDNIVWVWMKSFKLIHIFLGGLLCENVTVCSKMLTSFPMFNLCLCTLLNIFFWCRPLLSRIYDTKAKAVEMLGNFKEDTVSINHLASLLETSNSCSLYGVLSSVWFLFTLWRRELPAAVHPLFSGWPCLCLPSPPSPTLPLRPAGGHAALLSVSGGDLLASMMSHVLLFLEHWSPLCWPHLKAVSSKGPLMTSLFKLHALHALLSLVPLPQTCHCLNDTNCDVTCICVCLLLWYLFSLPNVKHIVLQQYM